MSKISPADDDDASSISETEIPGLNSLELLAMDSKVWYLINNISMHMDDFYWHGYDFRKGKRIERMEILT